MRKTTLSAAFICCSFISYNQTPETFKMVRSEYSGDLAYQTTAFVEQFWRIAGNTGFDTTIYFLAEKLEAAGYVREDKAPGSALLTYRIEKHAMKQPTWEPVSAEVWIEGADKPLLSSKTNRNMLAINSYATPEGGVTAEVVKLESVGDLQSVDVKGKIVYAETSPGALFTKAVAEGGAVGVISYSNPGYLQPEKNKTSIQFRGIPLSEEAKSWGIALSYEANEKLKAAVKNGTVKLNVKINTKIYPSEELTIIANAHGKIRDERFVFSAHIQEPGANDNASGVGAQLEMAVTAAKLVTSGQLNLSRTITFLWGDEIVSTRRYIREDQTRAEKIKWGISLDMVGENTVVTGGTFLIEKMPDPSAVWTRGEDKHSEWGAGDIKLNDMRPHYLNDFIIATMKAQGAFANWVVNTNPFEGGSDHTPFIDNHIPALLLWHFTDQFYHTDNDRLDKVSQETLRNVGTGALVSAITLVNANFETGSALLDITTKVAEERLLAELNLSKAAIQGGSKLDDEVKILEAWKDWYADAIFSINDINLQDPKEKKKLAKKITDAASRIGTIGNEYIRGLSYVNAQRK